MGGAAKERRKEYDPHRPCDRLKTMQSALGNIADCQRKEANMETINPDQFEFRITKNALHRASEIKSLTAENEHYELKCLYYGDYAADFEHNSLRIEDLTVIVKPKKCGPLPKVVITVAHGHLYLKVTEDLMSIDQIPRLKSDLDRATESARQIVRAINEYFPGLVYDGMEDDTHIETERHPSEGDAGDR